MVQQVEDVCKQGQNHVFPSYKQRRCNDFRFNYEGDEVKVVGK